MAGLAETTARLARDRRRTRAAPGPGGRMVKTATFDPNAGNLRMLTYHPSSLPDGAPLVVTLHGCGQEAEAYAEQAGWLAVADRLGFAVLAAVRSG